MSIIIPAGTPACSRAMHVNTAESDSRPFEAFTNRGRQQRFPVPGLKIRVVGSAGFRLMCISQHRCSPLLVQTP